MYVSVAVLYCTYYMYANLQQATVYTVVFMTAFLLLIMVAVYVVYCGSCLVNTL